MDASSSLFCYIMVFQDFFSCVLQIHRMVTMEKEYWSLSTPENLQIWRTDKYYIVVLRMLVYMLASS